MPTYEYQCATCGRFSALHRLSDYAEPAPCPDCGRPSPRTVSCPAWLGASERQRRYDGESTSSLAGSRVHREAQTMRQHAFGCSCCRSVSLTQAIHTDMEQSDVVD